MVSRIGLLFLTISLFLVYAVANATVPLYPLWQQSLHYSEAGTSVIFICYNLGIASVLVVLHAVRSLRSSWLVLCGALILALVSTVLFGHAHSLQDLMGARFLIGMACGTFVSCGISLIIKIGLHERIHATPLITTVAVVLGFGVGPFYSGVLADYLSSPQPWVFGILAVALLACLLALLFGFRPRQEVIIERQNRLLLREQRDGGGARDLPLALMITGIFAGPFALSALFLSLGPAMIADLMHDDRRMLAGAIPLVLFSVGAAFQLLLKHASTMRLALLSQVSAVGSIVMVALACWQASAWWMAGAAVLTGIAQSLSQLAGMTLIKKLRPFGTLEHSTSLFFLGGYLTAACGVLIFGLSARSLGLAEGAMVFMAICLVIVLVSSRALVGMRGQLVA